MKLTQQLARQIGEKELHIRFGADDSVPSVDELYRGMKDEHEEHAKTLHLDGSYEDWTTFAKVAYDHLKKDPHYYDKIAKLTEDIAPELLQAFSTRLRLVHLTPQKLQEVFKSNPDGLLTVLLSELYPILDIDEDERTTASTAFKELTRAVGGGNRLYGVRLDGSYAGFVYVGKEGNCWTVHKSYLYPKYRGQGIGKTMYYALNDHLGCLRSDTITTSRSANRVWKSLDATPIKKANFVSKQRFELPHAETNTKALTQKMFESSLQEEYGETTNSMFSNGYGNLSNIESGPEYLGQDDSKANSYQMIDGHKYEIDVNTDNGWLSPDGILYANVKEKDLKGALRVDEPLEDLGWMQLRDGKWSKVSQLPQAQFDTLFAWYEKKGKEMPDEYTELVEGLNAIAHPSRQQRQLHHELEQVMDELSKTRDYRTKQQLYRKRAELNNRLKQMVMGEKRSLFGELMEGLRALKEHEIALKTTFINETENSDVKFFRSLINTVINDNRYINKDMTLNYKAHKTDIDNFLVGEFQKYNYKEAVYAPLVEVMQALLGLIEQKRINLQQVRGYNDVAFLRVWQKIAKQLETIKTQKTVEKGDKTDKKVLTSKLLT